jgi:Family of unknown function (DUF6411)
MTIAVIVVVCVVLFLLALAFPLMSRRPQRGVGRGLGAGARAGRRAPGPLGRVLSKSFSSSRRATDASGGAGRRLRGRLPF